MKIISEKWMDGVRKSHTEYDEPDGFDELKARVLVLELKAVLL